MNDLDALRLNNPLPNVINQMAPGVALQADGREFIGCCPFHDEKSPSFTVFQGRKDGQWRFHCFGCDVKPGDVIDFVATLKGVSVGEAIRILSGAKAGPNRAPAPAVVSVDPYAGIVPLDPPTEIVAGRKLSLFNPKRGKMGSLSPSLVHPYRRLDGSMIGYVLRHEMTDGGKETPSVHWVRLPSGDECWCRFPFEKPRPLYGLELIGDAKRVFVVEGEKCKDAFAETTGGVIASWIGGTNGVIHTDWSPLFGKDVLIWPDLDGPGAAAALQVREQLIGRAKSIRFIDCFKGT